MNAYPVVDSNGDNGHRIGALLGGQPYQGDSHLAERVVRPVATVWRETIQESWHRLGMWNRPDFGMSSGNAHR